MTSNRCSVLDDGLCAAACTNGKTGYERDLIKSVGSPIIRNNLQITPVELHTLQNKPCREPYHD